MSIHSVLRAAAAAAALATLAISVPIADAAEPAAGSSAVTTTMTLDPAVATKGSADANGDIMLVLQSGRSVSVPQRFAALALHPTPPVNQSAVHTNGTVYGNCGYSSISLMHKANGYPVQMATSFHVYDAAVAYHWNAGIGGPQYQYNYGASGDLAARHDWSGGHKSDANYPHGTYDASVSTSSYALLYWGGACTSGGPTATTFL